MQAPRLEPALNFFLAWPDLRCAAQLVTARVDELDGGMYQILSPMAEAMRDKYPLAAVLLWRSMIDFSLKEGRSMRYAFATDHLKDCALADADIDDYDPFTSHQSYLEALRARYHHKTSFWKKQR